MQTLISFWEYPPSSRIQNSQEKSKFVTFLFASFGRCLPSKLQVASKTARLSLGTVGAQ